ncbi:MAG: hypothetical protein KGL48_03385 [Sphingomonadales bacterium]|nr:hypothetical protein [Sphingomonadales bacterium]MDE2567943.1 hypothetical protein [Sphingomonadales bacterium]
MAVDFVARGQAARSLRKHLPTPEDFGAVADLDGNLGTDNTAAFLALAEHINATGGHVVISGRYRITRGFPMFAGTWEFTGDSVIRNTTIDNVRIWNNTCVFIGTYFGYGVGMTGMNDEATRAILPMAEGSNVVEFADHADAAYYPIGTKVFLRDANFYPSVAGPSSFNKASHGSTVEICDAANGKLYLRDAAPDAITANGATNPTLVGNLGQVAPSGMPGVPDGVPRLALGVKLINAAFESANEAWSQPVHLSCADSNLEFRRIRGKAGLAGNPVMDTTLILHDGQVSNNAAEIAYYHYRVEIPLCRARRILSTVPSMDGVGFFVVSEYGHSVTCGVIDLDDVPVAGDNAYRPTVSILTPYVTIDTLTVRNAGYCAINIGTQGTRAEGTRIKSATVLSCAGNAAAIDPASGKAPAAPAAYGVQITSGKVSIADLHVQTLPSIGKAVCIWPQAGDRVALGNVSFAAGAGSGPQYRIADLRPSGSRKFFGKVQGHYTQQQTRMLTFMNVAGSGTAATIASHTIPAGTSGKTTAWRVRLVGNFPSGAIAAGKTLALKLRIGASNPVVMSQSLSAAQTGFVEFEFTFRKAGADTQLDYSGFAWLAATAVATRGGSTNSTSMATNDCTFYAELTATAPDSFNLREWSVTPLDDQFEPV